MREGVGERERERENLENKQTQTLSSLKFLQVFFMYGKLFGLVLTFFVDLRITAWCVVLFILMGFTLRLRPIVDNVVDLDSIDFKNRVAWAEGKPCAKPKGKDATATWLVMFYTHWANTCEQFSPTFSALALRYGCDKLVFGKVNIGRYGHISEELGINTNPLTTKELPTVALFQKGRELPSNRLPYYYKGELKRVILNEANLEKFFDLEKRFLEATREPVAGGRNGTGRSETKKRR